MRRAVRSIAGIRGAASSTLNPLIMSMMRRQGLAKDGLRRMNVNLCGL